MQNFYPYGGNGSSRHLYSRPYIYQSYRDELRDPFACGAEGGLGQSDRLGAACFRRRRPRGPEEAVPCPPGMLY